MSGGSSLGRGIAVGIFFLGAASLLGALLLRDAMAQAVIERVVLRPELVGFKPSLSVEVVGENPLPVAVEVRHLELKVGEKVLPTAVRLTSDQRIAIPAGAFEVRPSFGADGSSLTAIAGQGLSILFGQPLDYALSVDVGWGPLERRMTYTGTLSTGL